MIFIFQLMSAIQIIKSELMISLFRMPENCKYH